MIGPAIGSMSQALSGKQGSQQMELIDPVAEDAYWRSELAMQPYYDDRYTLERDYAPALALGYLLRAAHPDWSFEDAELEFHRDWQRLRLQSRLDWDQARDAVADAWDRYTEMHSPLTPDAPGQSDQPKFE